MAKIRADNNSKESGIALVTALVITVVVLMLISSLTYLFTKGFQTNIINRQFSTVYEAANGGVEYATGILNVHLGGNTAANVGGVAVTGGVAFNDIAVCNDETNTATITARTADGNYTITTTVKCLDKSLVGVGFGGALRFPPPPSGVGGGIVSSQQRTVYLYSINSTATETSGSTNIAKTEAIYRAVQ